MHKMITCAHSSKRQSQICIISNNKNLFFIQKIKENISRTTSDIPTYAFNFINLQNINNHKGG